MSLISHGLKERPYRIQPVSMKRQQHALLFVLKAGLLQLTLFRVAPEKVATNSKTPPATL